MELVTENEEKYVDLGGSDIWNSLYSTVILQTGDFPRKAPRAVEFLRDPICLLDQCIETARQMNMLRDELARHSPSEIIYDMNNRDRKAPWEGRISPIVTSCASFYTSADGKDFLSEIVGILNYGGYAKTKVYGLG